VAPTPRATLTAETAALSAAREALARGDAKGAFAAIDAYSREFPNGILVPEATVLRIEALLSSGDRAGAVSLAKRFVGAAGGSAYARRLARLLPEIEER
jgi:outer membrane protein assembly factor BamD (BamD/ComL family)